ncbi:hypothetical protein LN042_11195 [Kitasatospora sp. RB6PN24]|uniref:hypothetical protein n=1 Tax=Kitasatospora humi TaxID=2893891 RepID=UPI001E2AC2F5|nr:hypothetical protein [Kitasatospora humi]MCC9307660.1 hypothetical protein [Kitasatospora humi]
MRDERVWRCAECHRQHRAELAAAQWAGMPAANWLAGVAGPGKHDVVIAWGSKPEQPELLPCGVRWHAVRMAGHIGKPVLDRLLSDGASVGPVLRAGRTGALYWLLPVEVDARARWAQLPVRLLTSSSYLAAPSPDSHAHEPAGWVHWPEVTGTLTSPELLATAIERELYAGASR